MSSDEQMLTNTDAVVDDELVMRFKDAASGGAQLTVAEREELGRATRIGDYFLLNCTGLTSLDLSPLRNITRVGDAFLSGCHGLTSLDVSPLRNVTSVGHGFLGYCNRITQLDLSPLRNLVKVGGGFMFGCSNDNPDDRDELAQLLVASNKQRLADLPVSWDARRTALLIRNFAPCNHASDAFRIWSVMRHVVRFISPLRVPDAVLVAEEKRMLAVVEARIA